MQGIFELKERLYDEIVDCVVGGVPLPNRYVYRKPWLRDAAMMAMVFERVGELDRIREWILDLTDPYDRNNAGNEEPDNLGQALTLLSMVTDSSHPLVQQIRCDYRDLLDSDGHFTGQTDFGPHPVYQAKWLNYGFARLGLSERVSIPKVSDSYNCLFWMAFKEDMVKGKPIWSDSTDYPYLAWAEAHFLGTPPPLNLLGKGNYLTWETNASQADYTVYQRVDPSLAEAKTCTPHSWHAAEAWLYLDDIHK